MTAECWKGKGVTKWKESKKKKKKESGDWIQIKQFKQDKENNDYLINF